MSSSARLLSQSRLLASSARMLVLVLGFCASSSYAVYVTPYNAKQPLTAAKLEQVNQQLAIYDQFIQLYENSDDESKRIDVASVYFNKGKLLSENKRLPEALVAFDRLIEQFSDFPPVQLQVSYAYLGRMLIENEQGNPQKALKTADTLIRHAGKSQEPGIRETLLKAYRAKSEIYAGLKQYGLAASTTRIVLKNFTGEKAGSMRLLLAQAYVDQILFEANSLGLQPALKTFKQAIAYIGDDPDLTQYLAFAYFNKAVAYRNTGHYQQSLQAYDQMLALFEGSQQAEVQNLLVSAYSNQAENLVKLEQYDSAEMAIDRALATFAGSDDAALAQAIATLYNNKGFVLFAQAKQQWHKNPPQALENLQQARKNYEKALSFKAIPEMSYASLYENYAYTMYLMGEEAVAEQYLAKSLRIGGQAAYRAALADIAMHRIKEDTGFDALLKRLWLKQNTK